MTPEEMLEELQKQGVLTKKVIKIAYEVSGVSHVKETYQWVGPVVTVRDTERGIN